MPNPSKIHPYSLWITSLVIGAPLLTCFIIQTLTSQAVPTPLRIVICFGGAVVLPLLSLWYIHQFLTTRSFLPLARRLYWITALLIAGLVALTFGALGMHSLDALAIRFLIIVLPILLVFGLGTFHLAKHVNSRGQVDRKEWFAAGMFVTILVVAWGLLLVIVFYQVY